MKRVLIVPIFLLATAATVFGGPREDCHDRVKATYSNCVWSVTQNQTKNAGEKAEAYQECHNTAVAGIWACEDRWRLPGRGSPDGELQGRGGR